MGGREMLASWGLLFIGVAVILWGMWGDFVSKSRTHLALRLESGIAFLAASVVCYVFTESKETETPPVGVIPPPLLESDGSRNLAFAGSDAPDPRDRISGAS